MFRGFALGHSLSLAALAATLSEPRGFADGSAYRAPRKRAADPVKKSARKRQKKARRITKGKRNGRN